LFKAQQNTQAIARYNMAANIAIQRPPWEASQALREELAAVLSNRSAAYVASDDPISGLADADAVIALKKPWPKGHFRKAKALLAMERLEDAKDAVEMGLAFEPNNDVRLSYFFSKKKGLTGCLYVYV
jgi:translocation protein SEC72